MFRYQMAKLQVIPCLSTCANGIAVAPAAYDTHRQPVRRQPFQLQWQRTSISKMTTPHRIAVIPTLTVCVMGTY